MVFIILKVVFIIPQSGFHHQKMVFITQSGFHHPKNGFHQPKSGFIIPKMVFIIQTIFSSPFLELPHWRHHSLWAAVLVTHLSQLENIQGHTQSTKNNTEKKVMSPKPGAHKARLHTPASPQSQIKILKDD